jgi:CubicO group peptidase (beta-lactamase class C family)
MMADEKTAAETDPVAMGWMQGFPPAPDRIVRIGDGFPKTRWTFSHMRELAPTSGIRRGHGAPAALPVALRRDLDDIRFATLDGVETTWRRSLDEMFTDGIVVLHRGAIVYERYFGALQPHGAHIAYSVTKSFVGLLAATLAHEGALDPGARVPHYLPELGPGRSGGAYADATIRQVMDMTIGVDYSEAYTDPNSGVAAYATAVGMRPRPADYSGPETIPDFLTGLKKSGEHGHAFAYKTCNTEVLAWILQRLAQTSFAELVSQRLWTRLGVEEDASIVVDRAGMAMAGGGMSLTLRDLARFGEMMRSGGSFNGRQIIPTDVVEDIAGGADRENFRRAGYVTLPGASYRNQWWVLHNRFGAYSARGIHGQACYVAPGADMVIARFASHPTAANGNGPLDRVSLPAYEALAEHLRQTT